MIGLERRCRWLLRVYPASYRAARGDELLATLLESTAPGQLWPGWREIWALLLGGLRVRSAQNHCLSTAANLRLAVMLGLATTIGLLGTGTAGSAQLVLDIEKPVIDGGGVFDSWTGVSPSPAWLVAATFALMALAPVLIWTGRRSIAVPGLLAAAALATFAHWPPAVAVTFSVMFVALATVTALGADRPPRLWLCWYALPLVWILIDRVAGTIPLELARVLVGIPFLPLFVALALLWATVDARPAFALAVLIAVVSAILAGGVTSVASPGPGVGLVRLQLLYSAVSFGVGLAVAVPAGLRMRRQAVL